MDLSNDLMEFDYIDNFLTLEEEKQLEFLLNKKDLEYLMEKKQFYKEQIMDLYDMEFLQVRAGRIKIKSKEKGVYADQLGKMFKKNTGMNVRL